MPKKDTKPSGKQPKVQQDDGSNYTPATQGQDNTSVGPRRGGKDKNDDTRAQKTDGTGKGKT